MVRSPTRMLWRASHTIFVLPPRASVWLGDFGILPRAAVLASIVNRIHYTRGQARKRVSLFVAAHPSRSSLLHDYRMPGDGFAFPFGFVHPARRVGWFFPLRSSPPLLSASIFQSASTFHSGCCCRTLSHPMTPVWMGETTLVWIGAAFPFRFGFPRSRGRDRTLRIQSNPNLQFQQDVVHVFLVDDTPWCKKTKWN